MKQSTTTSFLSDEKIYKLIYSGNQQDYQIGVASLLKKYISLEEVPTSLDFFHFSEGSTEVYKCTGNIQKEVIIGQTGILIRNIRKEDSDHSSVKIHWR